MQTEPIATRRQHRESLMVKGLLIGIAAGSLISIASVWQYTATANTNDSWEIKSKQRIYELCELLATDSGKKPLYVDAKLRCLVMAIHGRT